MIVTYKDFHKLRFPLFKLPNSNWYLSDGTLFLDGLIVDDRKMPGTTLGIRRMQSGWKKENLLPLRRAVVDVPTMLNSKVKTFIDSHGKPFIYEKTLSSPLLSYKISRIEKKGTASLLWLHGVSSPITIPRPPLNDPSWARLLHLGPEPWQLYDYAFKKEKPSYRRV